MADFVIEDSVPYVQIKQMTEFIIDKFLSGEIDTVEVLYPRFINVLTQAPSFAKLLPIHGLDEMITISREKCGTV